LVVPEVVEVEHDRCGDRGGGYDADHGQCG